MSTRRSMGVREPDKPRELDLLGQLLTETLKFSDSSFNTKLILRDRTTIADVSADELFYEQGSRWFMRAESIPGDLAIKAIAVDTDGLYIETSPIDDERANAAIAKEVVSLTYDERNFFDSQTKVRLMAVSEVLQPEADLRPRSLCTIPFKGTSDACRQLAVRIIDALYNQNCFITDESTDVDATQAAPKSQDMLLQLDLQQRLQLEQRPLLSLKLQIEGRVEMRMNLQAMFALERRLLVMKPAELTDFVSKYLGEHGEERTKSVLLFVVAGRIKRAFPGLSWKQVRKLAHQKLTSVPKSV